MTPCNPKDDAVIFLAVECQCKKDCTVCTALELLQFFNNLKGRRVRFMENIKTRMFTFQGKLYLKKTSKNVYKILASIMKGGCMNFESV